MIYKTLYTKDCRHCMLIYDGVRPQEQKKEKKYKHKK
jgi:hypothetical protein